MTNRRRDRDAERLSRRLDQAAGIIPNIRDHLNEQRSHLTTIRAASTTPGSRTIGSHSDPTGHTLEQLSMIDYREGLVDDALKSIEVGINVLDEVCRQALGYRAPKERTVFEDRGEPICHWAVDHQRCDQPVSSYPRDDGTLGYRMGGQFGGLCDTHRARARRTTGSPVHDEHAGRPGNA